jgi:glycosyltransferase involved in cell wall biosynthesis
MSCLVFVATELFPYTPGVIGHVMSSMLRSLGEADRLRTTLVIVDAAIDTVSFKTTFPNVELVEVDTRVDRNRFIESRQHPPASAYSNTPWHWRSACVFRALAALSKDRPIEYLEFPDLGGLAFCTLQECRIQGFLPDAVVAVRLHGSHTALLHAEARPLAIADLNLSDLERKCLRDCDCVIAPSPAVSEAVREVFGFVAEEWEPRVVCHLPPVALDRLPPAVDTAPASPDQAMVFASEFQPSGRPDLFVRAAAGLMRNRPHYTGSMVLGIRGIDDSYSAQIERLVPPTFAERSSFMPQATQPSLDALLAGATVVFPGAFEASSAIALEASLLGGRVILNGTNPAFGEDTPWLDGINCLKFDGTAQGLVRALERNFDKNEMLVPVRFPESPWPWVAAPRRKPVWRALDEQPAVSIVVPHYNLGAYLQATLDNLAQQTYGNIEVVVVDDASTEAHSVLAIEELARQVDARLKVVRLTTNVGLAAARNVGVRHATGRYVLTLDADDLVHPRFLEVGVAALENGAAFDLVVTPAGYFIDGEAPPSPGAAANFSDYAMFSGEAVVAGLLENRFSTATALFRKSALDEFPYLESLNCYEDWSLFMRMCDAGRRFLVTTDVFFFYRKRRNSMVHTPRDLARKRIEYSDLLRTSAAEPLREKSRHLLLGLGAAVAGNLAEDGSLVGAPGTETTAQEVIDGLFGPGGHYDEQVVFASLKASRWLERKAPWLIRGVVSAARWVWQAYGVARGTR